MGVVAYLLPPLSGFLVYVLVADDDARWHGLQSVVFGTIWPAALFAGSWISAGATRVCFVVGVVVWVALVASAAARRPLYLPFVGRVLARWARDGM